MDVDACPMTSASSDFSVPFVDEDICAVDTKQRIMEILDNLEGHVEKFRKDASKLEEQKDQIIASLDTVKMLPIFNDLTGLDKDEALRYLERIIGRCQTVEVNVSTHRNAAQEDALSQVNHLIDNLVLMVKVDSDCARNRCIAYMNSCSSATNGNTDKPFETTLLGCTIDDQKRVKRRLQGLLKYLNKLGIVAEVQ